jgi:hypothetical protein
VSITRGNRKHISPEQEMVQSWRIYTPGSRSKQQFGYEGGFTWLSFTTNLKFVRQRLSREKQG